MAVYSDRDIQLVNKHMRGEEVEDVERLKSVLRKMWVEAFFGPPIQSTLLDFLNQFKPNEVKSQKEPSLPMYNLRKEREFIPPLGVRKPLQVQAKDVKRHPGINEPITHFSVVTGDEHKGKREHCQICLFQELEKIRK